MYSMLELRGVTKVYRVGGFEQKALSDVSINFRKSEFASILGPSGSGKTTLLNIIGGLDKYTSGDLIINETSTKKFHDKDWDAYRNHRIGFVFQSYNLIPHQTILQNVKLALTLSGISKRESIRRAKKALEEVGLKNHINKKPNQLSGGQMQRVAIARALVNNPEILLADEPTGALDSETSIQIMKILKEVSRNRLVIMVTHNPELAREYSTRIIELKDGKIISDSDKYDGKVNTSNDVSSKHFKHTKMSFITALGLSFKNLLTKKSRTILVAFAGSIGIIGIALILAVSTGFQNYVDYIQESTLSSYPLTFEESAADMSGILLGLTGDKGNEHPKEGEVSESMLITSMVNSVGVNDLKSFKKYLEDNNNKVKDDLAEVSYRYSIDPHIYTVDAAKKMVQLNPSGFFSSLLGGGSSVLSSYSSYTSVFRQITNDENSFKESYNIIAGRFPENYNEMILILPDGGTTISDFMVYSLGLRDTSEFSTIMTKIMGGESVEIKNTPKTFSYDELMNLDLRLIEPSDFYKYNEKYDVYEDMRADENYMQGLYDNANKLKIVGIATTDSALGAGGVGYLPSLIEHIVSYASRTDAVKRQLENPEFDVIAGKNFSDESNSFDFEFSDLVSVDNNKLQDAFNVNIDPSAITRVTTEYMESIAGSITTDITPMKETFIAGFDGLAAGLRFIMPAPIEDPDDNTKTIPGFTAENVDLIVDSYLSNISELNEYLRDPYAGSLKSILKAYLEIYGTLEPDADYFGIATETVKSSTEFDIAAESIATFLTEAQMKQAILAKVGALTSYLSDTFANSLSVNPEAITGAFTLNFSEDELARVVSSMFNRTETNQKTNLIAFGYQDLADPTMIYFYFNTFEGKENFLNFVDEYNDLMEKTGHKEKVIEYSDTTGALMDSVKTIVDAVSYVLIAFVSISLVVSSIMIGVITYISVYERTKEIGILRAIGASKHNISSIFNAETFMIGLLSGLFGVGISYGCIPIINTILHHFIGDIPLSAYLAPDSAAILVVISIILTLIGGLIPAKKASKKDPVEALRSE